MQLLLQYLVKELQVLFDLIGSCLTSDIQYEVIHSYYVCNPALSDSNRNLTLSP